MILLIACLLYVNCLYESQQTVCKMNDVLQSEKVVCKVIDVVEIVYNLFAR